MAVPGLGRKFWTITSCTWPWARCESAMADKVRTRSARDSPIPTRTPVVKGMASRPAASSVASRRCGRLVGGAAVTGQVGVERLEHHALAGRDGSEAGELVVAERAGVGVGEEPCLVAHQRAHGDQVVDRGGVAVLVEPGPRRGVALLGSLAQGEQRLVTARGRAGAGDGQHLVGRTCTETGPGPAAWRRCSSRTGRDTAS